MERAIRLMGGGRGGGVVVVILLSVVVCGGAAQANVRSHALYARGLIPFNGGRWQEAYQLFDQAVQVDSTDAVALYYRGLTAVRLDHTAAAITDMEQALALDPSLAHAALDLGITYFDTGQYAAAKPWLERAYKQGNERLVCAFFLGVTLYRLGDEAAALVFLNEAQADPEVRAAARYYAGLVLSHQGDTTAAGNAFTQVAKEQPQSEIGRAARRYAGPGEARQPPSVFGGGVQKPWSVYGKLGFEYDSNVLIAPSNSSLKTSQGINQESDGRTVIGAGGGYTLLDTDMGSVRASYDFYQSIHFQLTEFDLQGHRVRLDLASPPALLRYGISGTYDFYALDYQSFFQEVLGTPWVAVSEREDAATQVYYTARGRDFFRDPYDPSRDALDQAVGVRQVLLLGAIDGALSFGYQFDSEDTLAHGPAGQPVICSPTTHTSGCGARDFEYNANQLDVGLTAGLFGWARGQAAYQFRLEDYQFPNSRVDFAKRRHDNEHQFALGLEHDVTSELALTLDFVGVINNSNIDNFEYDRDIVSIGARVVF
jgi:predicted negative regulator of RcsB-dependent stress response